MALSVPVVIIVHATFTLSLSLSAAQAASADEVTYGSSYVMDDPQDPAGSVEKPPVPPGAQRISFKPPQMDEEETESTSLPDAYRCDACAAIAYQIEAQCVTVLPPTARSSWATMPAFLCWHWAIETLRSSSDGIYSRAHSGAHA